MQTGKLNRLTNSGWIQRTADRREKRRSRRGLVAKQEIPQKDLELRAAEPEEAHDNLAHLDQGEQSDRNSTKSDEAEGRAAS